MDKILQNLISPITSFPNTKNLEELGLANKAMSDRRRKLDMMLSSCIKKKSERKNIFAERLENLWLAMTIHVEFMEFTVHSYLGGLPASSPSLLSISSLLLSSALDYHL
jgi:hypothetical protein